MPTNLSNFDTINNFKEGDTICSEWTINGHKFWWKAVVSKRTIMAKNFGKPCRIYVLEYEPNFFYPKGKIMKHCFIDELRLLDLEETQLVSYFQ